MHVIEQCASGLATVCLERDGGITDTGDGPLALPAAQEGSSSADRGRLAIGQQSELRAGDGGGGAALAS